MLALELEPTPDAPSIARAAIRGFVDDMPLDAAARATLELLVSEVVTNAVIHPTVAPGNRIAFTALRVGDVVRVEVIDQGAGFQASPREPRAIGGHGLFLLDQQATRWGIEQRGGTAVWFELAA
ncbi:MAG: ATP-binding protein [Solirubrobacteraceae bacterium]